MAHDPIIAFIGIPYDGAATLGWPGARYAPAEVRKHLENSEMIVKRAQMPLPESRDNLVRGRRTLAQAPQNDVAALLVMAWIECYIRERMLNRRLGAPPPAPRESHRKS